MERRRILAGPALTLALGAVGAALAACQSGEPASAGGKTAGGQPLDLKKVAASLQTKTAALIDAINTRNEASISRARADLSKEADQAEDAVKSETGPTANQVNSALNNIRTGMLSNDITRLERARTLLQQASQ